MRFVYSYLAVYGDPLLNPELDPYPDGLLQRLSAVGINGVWLHVCLRDLRRAERRFPSSAPATSGGLANLRALVERAKKYGVRRVSLHERAAGDAGRFLQESPRDGRRPRKASSRPFALRIRPCGNGWATP